MFFRLKGNYEKALANFQAAKDKVSNNSEARKGIRKSQDKLDELEKNRQAKLGSERERQAHDNAWRSAKSANTIAAYEAYQKKYRNGKYYTDAASEIKKLRKEAAKNINSGTFKDSRDGQSYKWVRLKDGKKWMAENLNYETNNSWWYDNKRSNGDKYGRLYTWQAAKKPALMVGDCQQMMNGGKWQVIMGKHILVQKIIQEGMLAKLLIKL